MFDSGRTPQRPATADSDRQRFLKYVAIVTGSRQVSLSQFDKYSPRPHSR
jgi:hypothetical protein